MIAAPLRISRKEVKDMSKGYSELFKIVYSSERISELRNYTNNAVLKMINKTEGGKDKSVAVGAFDLQSGEIVTAFAGEPPAKIHPLLLERAKSIGGIGSHGLTEKNIVGVCAEFHAVNSLLNKGCKWENIRICSPIRPRTGKEIPMCDNCKTMFYDIIDEGEK